MATLLKPGKTAPFLTVKCKAGESDGLMENISGEAEGIDVPRTSTIRRT